MSQSQRRRTRPATPAALGERVAWSSYSGWSYYLRGTTLSQVDGYGRVRRVDEYPTVEEAKDAAAGYATY